MGSLVHLSYKSANGGGVPSPVDGNTAVWPLDYWASLYQKLSRAGSTVPMLPPVVKGASLGAGYDPKDHYDLGCKVQSGRRETRYGSIEQLRRNVAIANRNGMTPGVNVVHHHLDGGKNGVYDYPAAEGPGRFPKDRNCFWYWSKEQSNNPDRVPDPSFDGGIWSYGDEFRWLSGTYGDGKGTNGPGYVARELIDSLRWQLKTLGVRQVFLDDVKGTSAGYVGWLMYQLRTLEGLINFAFGEYYDGNPQTLYNWVHSPEVQGRCGVLDFTFRFALRNWCNSPDNYDMRNLFREGFIHWDAFNGVTFADDADTDESGPIFQRAIQACAAQATMPGYPMFFGKYMWKIPGSYGMLDPICDLILIHEKFANGPMVQRWSDRNFIVFERPQAPGLVTVLSNHNGSYSNPKNWGQVTVQTEWWPGTWVKDYTGHSAEVRTINSDGTLTVPIPPSDAGGRGYSAWSQIGHDGPIHRNPVPTQQTFYGAADLYIGRARPEGIGPEYIWCEGGTPIRLRNTLGNPVHFDVVDMAGNVAVPKGSWSGRAQSRGWHKVMAYSASGLHPWEVEIEYTATADLKPADFGDPTQKQAPIVAHSEDPYLTQTVIADQEAAQDEANEEAAQHDRKLEGANQ